MLVKRTDAKSEDLLDPANAAWRTAKAIEPMMSPASLQLQVNDYVRTSWEGRPYGNLPGATMKATGLHNGETIFFRLTWEDDSADEGITDINQFPDAAGVMFQIGAGATLAGMGSKGQPVNAWLWRPDWERPKNIAAEGMGTTQRREDPALASNAKHTRGRWNLVISRSLNGKRAPSGTANLKPGNTTKIGFAVWQGSNQERAGIKAFSTDWDDLEIEA